MIPITNANNNIICAQFSLGLHFDGASLKNEMRETINHDIITITVYSTHLFCRYIPSSGVYQLMSGNDAINIPAAGIGIPVNEFFINPPDTLYRASLKAPAHTGKNAGANANMLTSRAPCSDINAAHRNLKSIIDGATPNETISASESRSLPKGEKILSPRAVKPSNTSNTAATKMK